MQPFEPSDQMNRCGVLFLGPETSPTLAYLRRVEPLVMTTNERIDRALVESLGARFAVSHGYRYTVKQPVLDYFEDRIVNLHPSYLPWNRGQDPNLWSFVDGTPKGVTIHHMDAGLDTGDIIAQRELHFSDTETLRSTYDKLQAALTELFSEEWPRFRRGCSSRRPQVGPVTFHLLRDREKLADLLAEKGWDTPVSVLVRYAAGLSEELRRAG